MNQSVFSLLLSGTIIMLVSGCSAVKKTFAPDNTKIRYNGRIAVKDTAATLYWPGSSIKTSFKGTGVRATLSDQHGRNYYNVIIDDDSVYMIKPDSLKKSYVLASGLPRGRHTVELFRRTGWGEGSTLFYGFEYDERTRPISTPAQTRMIEFYGNSITVGAANENLEGDSGGGLYSNNYLSYGALTARHYNAAYSCIARSGIGLTVSWFRQIMTDMYNCFDPFDSASVWDFSKAEPDIVVINLFQNDHSLAELPDHSQFKYRFGEAAPGAAFFIDAYERFISLIRGHYPNAHIICVLGSMDAVKPGSPWPGYIEKAVSRLQDPKIHAHFFEYINKEWHPKINDHKKMSESLIRFIDQRVGRWGKGG
ncbi:MAG TPA: SGNH/GDSL hydrolase family protein [Flavitalea sp.]|nr:SGNH/GDSL hydrolase family protein [Flavitalea sp.]